MVFDVIGGSLPPMSFIDFAWYLVYLLLTVQRYTFFLEAARFVTLLCCKKCNVTLSFRKCQTFPSHFHVFPQYHARTATHLYQINEWKVDKCL